MRKFISIVLAIVLLAGSYLLAKYMINSKQKPRPQFNRVVKTVFVDEIVNADVPIVITANGNLVAKNKIELFSEVQGVLKTSNKEFKSGTLYRKGEQLIKINSDEFYANLQAQKSNFFNALTSIMPDIQLDYPNEYNKWQSYLQNFDMNSSVAKLPETSSDKEKFFISGRGIMTSYYNVKNLEVKLSKYVLRAPFRGVLTEALVNPGTLIRPGQKLGEYIDPSLYEMEVSIKSAYKDLLQVQKEVRLENLEKTKTWTGKVVRINGKVDLATQTIKAFIEVKGDDLKEGQYLEIGLGAKTENNAYEIPRNLLVDNSKLFIVRDTVLDLIEVNPVFESINSVVIKGLEDGTKIISRPVPGAHKGMLVKIFNENKGQ